MGNRTRLLCRLGLRVGNDRPISVFMTRESVYTARLTEKL